MNVSVVIATYNGEKYIVEQLNSIIGQLDSEDELIICDDCSNDSTVSIICEYIKHKDLNKIIHLECNETNMGFQGNFHKALQLAHGEFVFFSDQDDIWEGNKISIMVQFMMNHTDCKLLCCDYDIFNTSGNKVEIPSRLAKKMPNNGKHEKVQLTPQNIYIGQLGCCMCLRKIFCQQIEDYWFNNWAQDDRCWRLSLADDSLYIMHSNLVHHRIHENNTATYGKYHTKEKRVTLFKSMINADEMMLQWMINKHTNDYRIKLVKNNLQMMKLRVELIERKKVFNLLRLIRMLKYYQTKKSFFVDIYIMLH